MSTRGFIGFVEGDKEYITYNHSDSYPSGVGKGVLEWLKCAIDSVDAIRQRVRTVQFVDATKKPTPKQRAELRDKYHQNVSTGDDWYAVLRGTQGDPAEILACGYMTDGRDFPLDSVWCEWGYLIDLDAETFEVYCGYRTATAGRFVGREGSPVGLVGSWSFSDLPEKEEFLARFQELE